MLTVRSEVVKAYSAQDVNDLMNKNVGRVIGLLFINPHMQDHKLESKNFWESILGVMDSIKGIFTKSEVQTSQVEEQVAEKALLIEIDVSDPKLQYVEELYDVTTVPYLILLQSGSVLFKGVPDSDSYKTVIGILDKEQGDPNRNQDVIDVLKM